MKMRAYVLWVCITVLCGQAHGQSVSSGLTLGTSSVGLSAQIPVVVPPIGNVNFAKSEELIVTLRPDQTAAIYVWIISDHDSLNGIQFYLSLRRTSDSIPCRTSVTTLPTAPGFQKDKSRPIPIEVTGCGGNEAEGVLGILGSSGVNREVPIVVKRGTSLWITSILFATLALAVAVALVCAAIVSKHGHKLTDVIGNASWDFSASWASNITVFGTAFSFLIQLTIFPDKPLIGSRSEYTFLGGFALALVGFAPAAQRLIGQIQIGADAAGVPRITTNSNVAGFLFASVFTMWGTLLQIATQVLIIQELAYALIIKNSIAVCTKLFLVFAGMGLVVYCWRTILSTVAANATRTGTKQGKLETFSLAPVDRATAISRKISVL